jgi:hypothetical protein
MNNAMSSFVFIFQDFFNNIKKARFMDKVCYLHLCPNYLHLCQITHVFKVGILVRVLGLISLHPPMKVCLNPKHSYDILGAGMLWKPKDLHKIR